MTLRVLFANSLAVTHERVGTVPANTSSSDRPFQRTVENLATSLIYVFGTVRDYLYVPKSMKQAILKKFISRSNGYQTSPAKSLPFPCLDAATRASRISCDTYLAGF